MKISTLERDFTVGVDIGDRWSHYVALDNETGDLVAEAKVMTCDIGFRTEFKGWKPARFAIEAGTHSPWISRLLAELGHDVIVANPRKLRMIYESDRKNDKADARALARVARLDPKLLAPVQHRGRESQEHLALIRARDAMVRTRTLLVNHVRGAVKSVGGRLPSASVEAFPKQAAQIIPKEVWPALSPLIDTIAAMSGEIKKYDRAIERLAREKYPETKSLEQVNGVGALTALTYVLTLDDPKRFQKSRQVGPYLGLQPRQDESGTIARQLGITKAGDTHMRRLLIGSAHYMLGPFGADSDLRSWGLELAKRGGKNAKKRAVVAVARKLAVLLHRLWITGAKYEPLRVTSPGERGIVRVRRVR